MAVAIVVVALGLLVIPDESGTPVTPEHRAAEAPVIEVAEPVDELPVATVELDSGDCPEDDEQDKDDCGD